MVVVGDSPFNYMLAIDKMQAMHLVEFLRAVGTSEHFPSLVKEAANEVQQCGFDAQGESDTLAAVMNFVSVLGTMTDMLESGGCTCVGTTDEDTIPDVKGPVQ